MYTANAETMSMRSLIPQTEGLSQHDSHTQGKRGTSTSSREMYDMSMTPRADAPP